MLCSKSYVVSLLILERGRLGLEVEQVDIMKLENRRLAFHITAICECLDKVATEGKPLFGETALERAETRMWLRRMDLEIVQP
ncbi:hypothetical protein ASPCADRAFT_11037 [Aspergillus carbonarius ITEM 5010]|uniref:Uncharacterized protein n=1 Tax=Aspergillus carbonarius (strain ITEM 5010) TaxID=602072 RepID=A0A1R3R6E6_ASPC5|nr:hypothetical protein ASPCADRAFT_11037 [Aspergillus carbonarius ITEM 5010]